MIVKDGFAVDRLLDTGARWDFKSLMVREWTRQTKKPSWVSSGSSHRSVFRGLGTLKRIPTLEASVCRAEYLIMMDSSTIRRLA